MLQHTRFVQEAPEGRSGSHARVGDETHPQAHRLDRPQDGRGFPVGQGRVDEEGIAIGPLDFPYRSLIQPRQQAVLDVFDEELHLLPESDVQIALPDGAALAVAGAVALPDGLDVEVDVPAGQGCLRPFQADKGPGPAQLGVVQKQSLPQVESDGGNFRQSVPPPGYALDGARRLGRIITRRTRRGNFPTLPIYPAQGGIQEGLAASCVHSPQRFWIPACAG